jgi:hypothetical protein
MTVTANTTRNDYTAGSAQSVYNYTFQLNEAADVDVYLDGVKQTLNTHYTVQNVGNASGGTITFTLVDANNNPIHPTQGAVINIVMAMDLDRDTNYQPSGAFLAADVNNDFDRLWLATNQQQTAVNRSLRLQDDDVTTSSMELPLKDARKGKLLAFNATTGDPEATSNNQSNWDTAYNNSITSASFSGSTLTLGQQDGGTITASHTPYLPIAGGTLTGDLNLGFNDLTVGNLTIENLPANATQIVETGTGNFIIKATNLFLQDANDEKYIDCTSNGDVKLYHNNSQKLATTASGISVTGTLSATGYNSGNWDTAYGWGDHSTAGYLTSYTETDPVFSAHVASGITATNITNWNDAYNNKITAVNYSGSTLTLTQQDGGTLTTTINGGIGQWTTSGSNIYYNTGNVGIGTASPTSKLTLTGTGGDTSGIAFKSSNEQVKAYFTNDNAEVKLKHNGNVILCESAGNVGIGATSPNDKFHVANGSTGAGYLRIANNEGYARLGTDGGNLLLDVGGSEKARIDSSGNVGIGTTSPTNDLHITSTINSPILIETTHAGGNSRIEFRNENYRKNFGVNADGRVSLFDITNAKTPFIIDNNSENNTLVISGSNVGIGTSSPSATLEVNETSFQAMKLRRGTSGTDANIITFAQGDGTSVGHIGGVGSGGLQLRTGSGNGTERMRINSSGNVGIGTSSPEAILHTSTSGSEVARFESTGISPTYISFVNNGTTGITGLGSVDNDLAIYTQTVERIRINSSGNVGIGTTSPSQKLDVNGTAKATTVLSGDGTASAPAHAFANDTDTGMFRPSPDTLAFSEGGAERMRINSSGNVGIGTTSIFAKLHVNGNILATSNLSCSAGGVITSAGFMNSPAFAIKSWTSTSTTFYPMLDFRTSGNTIVGSIKSNNTSTQYNTSSDERLKENIRNAEDAGAKIDAIQVRQFDWKVNGLHEDYGVIAQELKEVAPEAVSEGSTEDDMMGVDYSKLVPTLIKEIQTLRNRVAQLENN